MDTFNNRSVDSDSVAIYIHIPFCHTRCHYCDFNTYSGMLGWRKRYVAAVIREITATGKAARQPDGAPHRCHTIFFGGGTPSLLPPTEIKSILDAVMEHFTVDPSAEITLEANPATLERHPLDALRATGVNRLSLGAQSFDPELLRWMGRIHTAEDITTAFTAARAGGFTNINLDFIFALPHQTMQQWQSTLETALSLAPEHLSLYSLIVEPETPLFDWVEQGSVIPAGEDIAADMYAYAIERLSSSDYNQYEISNWARSGFACEHNLTYWRTVPYLGIGAGAHGFFAGRRYSTIRSIEGYVAAIPVGWQTPITGIGTVGGAVVDSIQTDRKTAQSEMIIMALRLEEGLSLAAFNRRFQQSLQSVYGNVIDVLIAQGLIEEVTVSDDRRLRLTMRGKFVGNIVFEQFLPSAD